MSTTLKGKGFAHTCPLCQEEGTLLVDLDDVNRLWCSSCEEDLDVDSLRSMIVNLDAIISWLETAPEKRGPK